MNYLVVVKQHGFDTSKLKQGVKIRFTQKVEGVNAHYDKAGVIQSATVNKLVILEDNTNVPKSYNKVTTITPSDIHEKKFDIVGVVADVPLDYRQLDTICQAFEDAIAVQEVHVSEYRGDRGRIHLLTEAERYLDELQCEYENMMEFMDKM